MLYFLSRQLLKPAYKCDDWDSKLRLCILDRNIGDTVTFYLSSGYRSGRKRNITWMKEFHMQDTSTKTTYILDPGEMYLKNYEYSILNYIIILFKI